MGAATNRPEKPYRVDTDATLAANSDEKIPSQKAIKTYVDAKVSGGTTRNGEIIVFAGDSIFAASPYWISPDLENPIPPPLANDTYSAAAYVRARMGCLVHNLGIGGNTTRQILARFSTVLALNPTCVLIEGGINDVVQTDRAVPFAETCANITSMVTQTQNAGAIPILFTPTPTRLVTYSEWDAYHTAIDNIRTWINSYAAANNIILIDSYNAFIHALSGEILTGYFAKETSGVYGSYDSSDASHSGDVLHPNTLGQAHLGEIILRILQSYLLPGTQSKTDRKTLWTRPGLAAKRGYSSGDRLLNEKAGEGEFIALVKSGDTENLFVTEGNFRNINAPASNLFGIYPNATPPDQWWCAGDVCGITLGNLLYIYKVTTAGYSGAVRTPHCVAELLTTVKLSTEDPWTTPSLLNSWTNKGSPYANARYFKDSCGIVHLSGTVTGGALGTNIFLLTTGYKPSADLYCPVLCNGAFGSVLVTSAGAVQLIVGTGGSASTDLAGISFRAEA